jgi:hypothetical protein
MYQNIDSIKIEKEGKKKSKKQIPGTSEIRPDTII